MTWVVQNDATDPSAASNCKQNIPAGNDCYEWDVDTKKGTAKWAWKAGMTSGGMIGPLPSYDFCAVLKKGDVSGIDDYEVSCIFLSFFSFLDLPFFFFLSCSFSSFLHPISLRSLCFNSCPLRMIPTTSRRNHYPLVPLIKRLTMVI